MTKDKRTHYQVLGVPPGIGGPALHAAYITLAQQHHPDRAGVLGLARFQEITEAYGVLKNKDSRASYDRELAMLRPHLRCTKCNGTGYRMQQRGFTSIHKTACTACKGRGERE